MKNKIALMIAVLLFITACGTVSQDQANEIIDQAQNQANEAIDAAQENTANAADEIVEDVVIEEDFVTDEETEIEELI